MKTKVAIIVPYFGKFPEWIELYLYSCSKNPFIDFIFYTDCDVPKRTYSNTFFHPISFNEYCDFVSKRLQIDFHPSHSYKLCDLKPFYGIIHEQELAKYDWWGFGDIDLVYGNLTKLVNEKNLKKFDLLTTHADRIAGHFTIMRKESKYTSECLRIKNWAAMLTSEDNYGLDEAYLTRNVLSIGQKVLIKLFSKVIRYITTADSWQYWSDILARFTQITNRKVRMREYYTTFKPMRGTHITYNPITSEIKVPLDQGSKITAGGGQLYLHFLLFKKTQYWKTDQYWKDGFYKIPQGYDFSEGRIVEITTDEIKLLE